MTAITTSKRILVVLLLTFVGGVGASTVLDLQLEVRTNVDEFDRDGVWVGVFSGDLDSEVEPVDWFYKTSHVFAVSVPEDLKKSSLIFLRKNSIPITVSLADALLEDGIDVEFSEGIVIAGSVTSKANEAIAESSVSLGNFHDFKFTLPDPHLTIWEVEEDGAYEIRGLQPGAYELIATALEFMPASTEIELAANELQRVVEFQLPKAVYVSGYIMDRYRTKVRGNLEVVVNPPESQTTEVLKIFDQQDNLRVGPFAEGVTVELTAYDDSGRHSRPKEVEVPADDLELLVDRWVTLNGNVINSRTDEPIEHFELQQYGTGRGFFPVEVFAPNGQLAEYIEDATTTVEIIAPGFLWWGINWMDLEDRETFDLGTVKLEPAHTVRGRVTDSSTGVPIAEATVRRIELHEQNVVYWTYNNVVTTTAADGAFELLGFPETGGTLSVSAAHYQNTTVIIDETDAFQEIEIPIELKAIGSISGHVVSLTGEPLYPAYVRGGWWGKRTKEDGSFYFPLVGPYRIHASAESGSSQVLEGVVENGEHITDLKLVISEVARVYGTVEGLMDGETAAVVVSNRDSRNSALLEVNGPYEIRGVPIGEHKVICRTVLDRREFRRKTGTLIMDESMEVRMDFTFAGGNSLAGNVTAGGKPVPIVEVIAQPVDKNHVEVAATTKGDGSYVLSGLDEGKYRVRVITRGVWQTVMVAGQNQQLDFDLGSIEISGYVKSSDSVLGTRLFLKGFGLNGDVELNTSVDTNGFYRFHGFARGNYELYVSHPRHETQTIAVEVEDSIYDLDIDMNSITAEQQDKDLKTLEVLGF